MGNFINRPIAGGGGGSVETVNSKSPDGNGNVAITKADIGLGNVNNTSDANKPISTAQASELELKQIVFTGICQHQYLTENDIVIDCVSATPSLTIATVKNGEAIDVDNPICFYTDGSGESIKREKITPQSVNFTYTLGVWFFYFDSNGDLQASQTPWVDFSTIASVYRLYVNPTLSGQERCTVESIEFHKNDVSWSTHAHMHAGGTIWVNGGEIVSNLPTISGTGVPTTSPNADGRNTVVSLTTVKNQDDNMPYTITNSLDAVTKFNQDLGHLTAATITSLNAGLFKVRINDVLGRLFFLPATRFPFPWNVTTNSPEFITTAGVRTLVTDNRWFVVYLYALQDPRNGEAIKVVPEIQDFTSYTNAQASNWDAIRALYPTIRDNEIRQLYKLTYYCDKSGGGAYSAATKYSSLVRIDDIRTVKNSPIGGATGTVLGTNVLITPTEKITSTNAQAALVEIDKRTIAQYADLAAIKAVDTALVLNGTQSQVLTLGQYEFSSASTLTGDDVFIIVPTTGGGRWLLQTGKTESIANTAGQVWSGNNKNYRIGGKNLRLTNSDSIKRNLVAVGSSVMFGVNPAGYLTVGKQYVIETQGTTVWMSIGASSNVKGTIFTATGVGSGTGIAALTTESYVGLLTTELGANWAINNVSIMGHTSFQISSRFDSDVVPLNPDVVFIGLSPNNNGLAETTTIDTAATAIKDFERYLDLVVQKCIVKGYDYVVMGVYPKSTYTAVPYKALKDLNITLQRKYGAKYINILAVLEDGTGKIKTGIDCGDGTHMSAVGNLAMFNAIPSGTFEYMARIRSKNVLSKSAGLVLGSDTTTAYPLELTVPSTQRNNAFCTGVDVRGTLIQHKTIMFIPGTGNTKLLTVTINSSGNFELRNNAGAIITTTIKPIQGYNRIFINYDFKTQIFSLWINAVNGGNSSALSFYFQYVALGGGSIAADNSVGVEYRNFALWNTKFTDDEVIADANGLLLESSLMYFNALETLSGSVFCGTTTSEQSKLKVNSTTWTQATLSESKRLAYVNSNGSIIASATTISPTSTIFHVSGTTEIVTINLPYTGFVGDITMIPDGVFTFATSGNIAETYTATINRSVKLTYDGVKWYRV